MVQFDELFGEKNLVKILKFFLRNPSTEISYTELRKKAKTAKATLTKWLSILLKDGLIEVKRVGVTKLYRLNRGNPINAQLKILDNIISLTRITDIGKRYNVKIYLYGSAARGEDNEESDIYILIIGKIKKEQIINEINKISESMGRSIKIAVFTPLEWSRAARNDKPFYERVEKDKKEIA